MDLRLDEIPGREHLPPLGINHSCCPLLTTFRSGLKDFEEWLLFVEQNAETMYFVLWLREYNARYTYWMNITRAFSSTIPQIRTSPPPDSLPRPGPAAPSPSSMQEQNKCFPRQTLLAHSIYLPTSSALGPFHTPSLCSESLNGPSKCDFSMSSYTLPPPHHPVVLNEAEETARSIPEEYLDRIAASLIANIRTARATYGLVGSRHVCRLPSIGSREPRTVEKPLVGHLAFLAYGSLSLDLLAS